MFGDLAAAYDALYYLDSCNFDDILIDTVLFCDKHDCAFDTITKNIQNNFFVITGNINTISNLFYPQKLPNMDQTQQNFELFSTVGFNIG